MGFPLGFVHDQGDTASPRGDVHRPQRYKRSPARRVSLSARHRPRSGSKSCGAVLVDRSEEPWGPGYSCGRPPFRTARTTVDDARGDGDGDGRLHSDRDLKCLSRRRNRNRRSRIRRAGFRHTHAGLVRRSRPLLGAGTRLWHHRAHMVGRFARGCPDLWLSDRTHELASALHSRLCCLRDRHRRGGAGIGSDRPQERVERSLKLTPPKGSRSSP